MRYPSDDRYLAQNLLSAQLIMAKKEKYGPESLQVLWAEKVLARAAAKDKIEPDTNPPEAA